MTPHSRKTRRAPLAAATGLAAVMATTVLASAPAASARTAGARSDPAPATALINGAARYQTIAGFGASEAFGQAETVMNAAPAVQRQALDLLYSPARGAGLTILRNEISADPGSTIEPAAPSSPSAPPTYLPLSAINSDQGQLWFAQRIRAGYGVRDVFADAWSAPAFMKTNDSADNGGTLCGVPGATCASGDWRQAYANYLTQYARDYAAAGIRLSYVGPENEANIGPDYDSMLLSPAQTADFMPYLGHALAAAHLGTRAECCGTEGWDYAQQYAAAIEADPAARAATPLFTSHGYTAPPDSPLTGWRGPVWQTEWSTFEAWDPAWDDGTDASGLTWAQHIFTGLTSADLSAFLYWWGSTTPSENGDNEGLIEISGSTVIPSGRLWAFANYSRYVHPGAVRIAATTSDSAVDLTAFRNTGGSLAIVALNTSSAASTIAYSLSGTGTPNGATVVPY
ncbi:MAG: glycoside hydrolase family 30 beta sandwich domain-containing protein, partial [Streptosporangiaceae bacterium]